MTRSIEQIKNDCPQVGDLRKEASRLKREYNLNEPLIRDGKEIRVGTGRKQELIEYISKLEQLAESVDTTPQTIEEPTAQQTVEKPSTPPTEDVWQESVNKVEKEVIPNKQDADHDYTDSEEEKLTVAKILYTATEKNDDFTGLKQYHLDVCKSKKLFSTENFSKFAQLTAKARVLIEGYANSKSPSGKASPGGLQAIRVQIMKFLKQLCEADNDKFDIVNDRSLMDTFTDFDDAVRGAFKDISKLKYELYKEKRDSGERDVRKIKVSLFVSWAIDMVVNLPKNTARWKEVAIAIMLLTGRRQSEVMSSGVFEYVDDSHLLFEGQLKRHTSEPVPPTKIPVLGEAAQEVIDAIKWLEERDKRTIPTDRSYEGIQQAAKQSHNRCSRYIAETMQKLQELVDITNNKTWKDVKGNNIFKAHITRQIYAQICAELFAPDDQKKQSFIGDILLESREAAPSYDRDITILDIAECK